MAFFIWTNGFQKLVELHFLPTELRKCPLGSDKSWKTKDLWGDFQPWVHSSLVQVPLPFVSSRPWLNSLAALAQSTGLTLASWDSILNPLISFKFLFQCDPEEPQSVAVNEVRIYLSSNSSPRRIQVHRQPFSWPIHKSRDALWSHQALRCNWWSSHWWLMCQSLWTLHSWETPEDPVRTRSPAASGFPVWYIAGEGSKSHKIKKRRR